MSFVSWFWFFVAVFFAVCTIVLFASDSKRQVENESLSAFNIALKSEIIILMNQLKEYREKERKENFFDFEKVNNKKEK